MPSGRRTSRHKFEEPYKALLDDGVKFYACLGNHDSREQRFYKLFNMDGKLYYSFKAPKENVRFFALDSTYPVPEQIDWLEKELKGRTSPGRSSSSTIRSTPRVTATARTSSCAKRSSRSSSSTT